MRVGVRVHRKPPANRRPVCGSQRGTTATLRAPGNIRMTRSAADRRVLGLAAEPVTPSSVGEGGPAVDGAVDEPSVLSSPPELVDGSDKAPSASKWKMRPFG